MSFFYRGEVESLLDDMEHSDMISLRQQWTLCELIWGDSETWKRTNAYAEDARRARAIERALAGCIETARQIAIDVLDDSIQIDLLWNCCQGPYAELTAEAQNGPVLTRAAIKENAIGSTLAGALLATIAKARWKIVQAQQKAERDGMEAEPATDSASPEPASVNAATVASNVVPMPRAGGDA